MHASTSSHPENLDQRTRDRISPCVPQPSPYDRSPRCFRGNSRLESHAQRASGGINTLEGLWLATRREDKHLI
jgi:hypothetical protein